MTFPDLIFTWLALCSLVCFINWRRRQSWGPRPAAPFARTAAARCPAPDQRQPAVSVLDVRQELAGLLHLAAPAAARRGVQLQIASQPRLRVCADRQLFREAVNDLLAHAIARAGCESVLLGAVRQDGRVEISVTGDGLGQCETARRDGLQDAARLLALLGATLRVDARPNEGCTVVASLPEPAATPEHHRVAAAMAASQSGA